MKTWHLNAMDRLRSLRRMLRAIPLFKEPIMQSARHETQTHAKEWARDSQYAFLIVKFAVLVVPA